VEAFSSRPDRREVDLSGHAVLADGSKADVSLVDLSYQGCRIGCETRLNAGDRIKLAVFRLGLIDAEVRWYQNGEAGLTFEPTEATPTTHWPRRSQRVAVNGRVTMRKPGKPNFDARIFDISPEGCKVEFIDPVPVGSLVFIKFEGLETLEAEVCWAEEKVLGVNFAKAFHPAVFDMLMQRLGVAG
jgi:hypothetical protein